MNRMSEGRGSLVFACALAIAFGTTSLLWGQWQNPVIDTITNTQIRKETTIQSLCLDDSDMVHLVWKDQVTGGWRIFYCTNSPAGIWGTPQYVGDTMEVAFDPAVSWSSVVGEAFVVYEQNSDIYAAHGSVGLWQAEAIVANAQLDCSPTIAIDGWGMPHASWITDDPNTGQYKIAYAMGAFAGPYLIWDVQTLTASDLGPYGTGASPFIAVTPDGVAHIVYRGGDYGNYHIHHAWNSVQGPTVWDYEVLYSGNLNDFSASMVIEDDGACHLAVGGNDGWGFPGRIYYLYKPSGQAWQQYELASSGNSAANPSMSIDLNGRPHIVWMETSGNMYTGNIYYSRKNTVGNWQVSSVIGTDHFTPSFGIDGEGYGHVACHTGGNTGLYDIYHVKSSGALSVDEGSRYPTGDAHTGTILKSWPTLFQTFTEITYGNSCYGRVTLGVYNSIGERISVLADGLMAPGVHSVRWHPRELSAGTYFIRLIADGFERNTKCVYLP
ncbi:MAG: hypothetical protein JSW49_00155 [candidate division WOR-3 bacterium]|nr:MAG: hypothetical protein JSW49_00155 [candidate division WOR-3 bacterium]